MVLPLGDIEKIRIVPLATYTLIALNVGMYLFQLDRGEGFTTSLAATPYEITHDYDLELPRDENRLRIPTQEKPIPQRHVPFPVQLTMLTAMFLHSDPLHLAVNMLFLWIFGDNVEEVLGSMRYVLVYIVCGLAGTVVQTLINPNSVIPTLGASGAIAGIMGSYAVWFPRHRIRVLVFRYLIEMPALVVIGVWIVFQVWRGVGSIGHLGEIGGVAYLAHIGGAATGIVAAFLFYDRARAIILRNSRPELSVDP